MTKTLIIAALILVIGLGAGFYAGKSYSKVDVTPWSLALSECSDPIPPADKSFGSTTTSLVSLVGQYKQLQAACGCRGGK